MDFSRINEIRAIRLLLEMLRKKVGSPLSYASLSEDLQIAPNTVHKYIDYIRTKDGKEVDFALSQNDILTHFIEVKLSDSNISKNLKYFKEKYSHVDAVQLVHNARYNKEIDNIKIVQAGEWLSQLSA